MELRSEIIPGEYCLEEMNVFTEYKDCFVDVVNEKECPVLNILVNMGPLSRILRRIFSRSDTGNSDQHQSKHNAPPEQTLTNSFPASLAKQIDDDDMEESVRQDRAIRHIDALEAPEIKGSAQAEEDIKIAQYESVRQQKLERDGQRLVSQRACTVRQTE